HGFLEIGGGGLEDLAVGLRAASGPVGELDGLNDAGAGEVVFGLRARDGLLREGDALRPFAEDVELLSHVGDGVDVAGVSLARAQIFVLEEKVGVGAEGRLVLESASGSNTFGFGGQGRAGGEALLDGFREAEAGLGVRDYGRGERD